MAVAGTGAAAVGVAAATPSALASTPAARENTTEVTGSLVAHVRNVRTGEISIMRGSHEVVVHDKDLAARLANRFEKKD